jgi:hypothetical protein
MSDAATPTAAKTIAIATMATGQTAINDLKTLLFSLDLFYKACVDSSGIKIAVYVLTDSSGEPAIKALKTAARHKNICQVHTRVALDSYRDVGRRKDMEALPGRIYHSLFKDFTVEKLRAIEWALEDAIDVAGVWFLDTDICLFSRLPEIPTGCDLALSPHYIRAGDERLYGRYNAGFLWMGRERATELLAIWRGATHGSRFFEQAALEDVAREATALHEFPIQHNFGWWRLGQSSDPPDVIRKRFGYRRTTGTAGLTFDGVALGSIHSHLLETSDFNSHILKCLEVVKGSHAEAKKLWEHIKHMNSLMSPQVPAKK